MDHLDRIRRLISDVPYSDPSGLSKLIWRAVYDLTDVVSCPVSDHEWMLVATIHYLNNRTWLNLEGY